MAYKILKFRTVNRDVFKAIINGKKNIETRAATPKYREVKVGDVLTLVCGRDQADMKVVSVELFRTIGALLKKYKPLEINPKTETVKEARAMWHSFPGYDEKIKQFGLVAWKLK